MTSAVPAPVRLLDPSEPIRIVQRDEGLNRLILRARRKILAATDVEPASRLTSDVVAAMFTLLKLIQASDGKMARSSMRRAIVSLANCGADQMKYFAVALDTGGDQLRKHAALRMLHHRAMRAGRSMVLPKGTEGCQFAVLKTVAQYGYSDTIRHAMQLLAHMSATSLLQDFVPRAADVRLAPSPSARSAAPENMTMDVAMDFPVCAALPPQPLKKEASVSPLSIALKHPRHCETLANKALVFDGPIDDSDNFINACTLLTSEAAAIAPRKRTHVAVQCVRKAERCDAEEEEAAPFLFFCLVTSPKEMVVNSVFSAIEVVLNKHKDVVRPLCTDKCVLCVGGMNYTSSLAYFSELQSGALVNVTYTGPSLR